MAGQTRRKLTLLRQVLQRLRDRGEAPTEELLEELAALEQKVAAMPPPMRQAARSNRWSPANHPIRAPGLQGMTCTEITRQAAELLAEEEGPPRVTPLPPKDGESR